MLHRLLKSAYSPLLLVACYWINLAAASGQSAPANDMFANRYPLFAGTNYFVVDNSLATLETGEKLSPTCNPAGKSLWWRFTAPFQGWLKVRVTGTPTNSPLATVYMGSTWSELIMANSSCGEPILMMLYPGDSICLSVDSSGSASGPITLDASFRFQPPNDAFSDSILLQGAEASVPGVELSGATLEPGERNAAYSIWYSWRAPTSGRAQLSLISKINVYTGSSIPTLQQIRLVPISPIGWAFHAVEGTLYHFQVDRQNPDNWAAEFNLNHFILAPPTNDFFTNAILLAEPYTNRPAIELATVEPGEPEHLNSPGGKSLWWKWQSPNQGLLSLFCERSLASNVVISLYMGPSVAELQLVARETNGLRLIPMQANRNYFIAAAVPDHAVGDVILYNSFYRTSVTNDAFGNLLGEGSFESTGLYSSFWGSEGEIGGYVNERGGADGGTWPLMVSGSRLWQHFPTVPGRDYRVRFAYRRGTQLRVLLDDREIGVAQMDPLANWQWTNFVGVATQSLTRLAFENIGGNVEIDAVSVIWASEPATLVIPPVPITVKTGSTAGLLVKAQGVSPLSYQWFFEGSVIPQATNRSLTFASATADLMGSYHVTISNAFGAVTTAPVRLTVVDSLPLTIVFQPFSETVEEAGFLRLSVAALGATPMMFQWSRDGLELPGATNSQLIFDPVQLTNAGSYNVRVFNAGESAVSLPAVVTVLQRVSQRATISFENSSIGPAAAVYDINGVTRLSGSNYLAQLYVGSSNEVLRPAGRPTTFRTGGYFNATEVDVPTRVFGSYVLVQVRVWEAAKGSSYEEARALGGKYGKSEILSLWVNVGAYSPLYGLARFNLQPGVMTFSPGMIELVEKRTGGRMLWALRGEAGFRYLIERSIGDFKWSPLMVVHNLAGVTPFEDFNPPPDGNVFYRARIVD